MQRRCTEIGNDLQSAATVVRIRLNASQSDVPSAAGPSSPDSAAPASVNPAEVVRHKIPAEVLAEFGLARRVHRI